MLPFPPFREIAWVSAFVYYGTYVPRYQEPFLHRRAGADRRPHRKAPAEGNEGAGRVSRPFARRPDRRHCAARLRRQVLVWGREPEAHCRVQEDLPPRSRLACQPQDGGAQTGSHPSTSKGGPRRGPRGEEIVSSKTSLRILQIVLG